MTGMTGYALGPGLGPRPTPTPALRPSLFFRTKYYNYVSLWLLITVTRTPDHGNHVLCVVVHSNPVMCAQAQTQTVQQLGGVY